MNTIIKVEKESIGEEMGVEAGDVLISIDEKEIKDVFDYRYAINTEYLELTIEKPDGEQWLLEIEKDYDEDLGIIFEDGLMDRAKHCTNKCVFCFIDQLPRGMRETLYFKDDDSRLSFLQGNYVTLTNMKEEDLDRIIFYHLSPINVSVHTTDMELRYKMLKNPKSKELMNYIKRISESGIEMNFQVVLCKGLNDGENLIKTVEDLSQFLPKGKSMSIVPVGISKFRENLYPLHEFKRDDCRRLISHIENLQEKYLEKYGTRFVYLSDEFYLVGNVPIPPLEYYEDFPQIENGVGMMRSFVDETIEALNKFSCSMEREVSIATGALAYDDILELSQRIMDKNPKIKIHVYKINNDFFGEKITVAGLLTGTDIINQLSNKILGESLLISKDMLKSGEEILLDDITVRDISDKLNTDVLVVENNGFDFVKTICQ